jgi:uncharacterized protein (TIGR03083 family)
MDPHPLLTALESDSAVFSSVAASALRRGDTPVPCCPGWTVSDLVSHVAGTHALVAEWVTFGRRPDTWEHLPPAGVDLVEWQRRCSARLLDAVGTVDPDTPCSTWSPYDQTIGFWVGRMAHETAVHRVDLEQSLGIDWEVDPAVAVDGIGEVFRLWLNGHVPPGMTGSKRSVRVVAFGAEDNPMFDRVIRPYDELVHYAPYEQGVPVDAVLSGPADAIWAWCWGRNDATHPVAVTGDRGAVDELRAILAAAEQ